MKKTFTNLSFLAFSMIFGAASLSAQIFSEDFSSSTKPDLPSAWTQINNDGSTPPSQYAVVNFGTRGWASYGSPNFVAISYSLGTAQADDWMISPAIEIPATGDYGLFWSAFTPKAPSNDGYEIYVSTTDKELSSFTDKIYSTAGERYETGFIKHYADLEGYNGKTIYIAFRNNSRNKTYLQIDDIKVDAALPPDASITDVTAGATYVLPPSSQKLSVTISNPGGKKITSAEISWTLDGGAPVSQTLTGLNIEPLAKSTILLTSSLSRPAKGTYPIQVTIDNLNGADIDNNTANDMLAATFYAIGQEDFPPKRVIIEEGTGTWCGWCPRGTVFMDSIAKVHPTGTVLIAVHNQDPMANAIYDAGMATMISGYPSALFNRNSVADPSAVFTKYNELKGEFGLAQLGITAVYNPATKMVTAQTSALFKAPADGDFRLVVVITEDSVTGTAATYAQTNYYSGGAQGKMGGYESKANPVPANQMRYDFVAREIIGGFKGMSGSLPTTIASGATETYTFTSSQLNSVIRPAKLKAHVMLFDVKKNTFMNGMSTPVTIGTGISETEGMAQEVTAFPNPTADNINVKFNLAQDDHIAVAVVNIVGETVIELPAQQMTQGANSIEINTAALPAGTYFVQLGTSTGVSSHAFVKAK